MFVIDRFFSSSLHAKKRTDSNIARTNAVVGTHTFGNIPMTDLTDKTNCHAAAAYGNSNKKKNESNDLLRS